MRDMLEPLADLNHDNVRRLLAGQYEASGELLFEPRGEDSWGYRMGGLWVSVRRDLRGHNPACYAAAARLRQAGLTFVLSPLPGVDGRVSHEVDGYPVVVFPYLAGLSADLRSAPEELAAVVGMLQDVHRSGPQAGVPAEAFDLPFDDELRWAMATAAGGAEVSGPYTACTREAMLANLDQIAALRAEFFELGRACAAAAESFVLTHGEPGTGNILRHDGRLLIADWGETMLGPPERDWFHLWRCYGSGPACRREQLRFYELRWFFNELTEYAARFFGPHPGDSQDAGCWDNLLYCLAETC
jgi:spectinomycin phosphotransferase